MSEKDLDILARTIYGEARGEGEDGMEAVACVVMNRYRARKWYTGYIWSQGEKIPSIAATCLKKYQFSCWNKNDPNFLRIKQVQSDNLLFRQCLNIARTAISGKLVDMTRGAVYYHTKQIKPEWARGHYPCYELKNHLFYNDI